MARWFLDCQPVYGRPWRVDLAQRNRANAKPYSACATRCSSSSRVRARRHWRSARASTWTTSTTWCDHLFLYDESNDRVAGTYRVLHGSEAAPPRGLLRGRRIRPDPARTDRSPDLAGRARCIAADYRSTMAFQVPLVRNGSAPARLRLPLPHGRRQLRAPDSDTLSRVHSTS